MLTKTPAILGQAIDVVEVMDEVRHIPYLPQKAPLCHWPPVLSQNAFHWAGKLPIYASTEVLGCFVLETYHI